MPIPPFAVPNTRSEEEIKELFKVFKPIKIKNNKASLIETKDLKNSFLWDADKHLKPYKGDLYTLYKFHSVHGYGYHGMFKPSITEVLQQIPQMYTFLKGPVYFEVIGPEDCHDLNMWIEHVHAGVHVATTSLYLSEPSLNVMSELYHTHPQTLSMEPHQTPVEGACLWIEAMKPEERVELSDWLVKKTQVDVPPKK